ncbi:MAG: hypothetical protein ACO20I_12340 [bacterium]
MELSKSLCDVRDEIYSSCRKAENLRGDLQSSVQVRAGKTEVSVGQSENVHRLQRNIPSRSTSKNLQ